jgi:hypothetical protein
MQPLLLYPWRSAYSMAIDASTSMDAPATYTLANGIPLAYLMNVVNKG